MKLFSALLACLLFVGIVSAAEIKVSKFSDSDLTGWEEKSFKGKTVYTFVKNDEHTVLQAKSSNNASGLFKKVQVPVGTLPVIRWSWKVQHTLDREDATKKFGDDFAARVYVVFPRGIFQSLRAINYVWSAYLPIGTFLQSPFTANAVYCVVESGNSRVGTWVTESRNYLEDYRRAFHEEPPQLGAVAVMTDTDNTHSEVTAWYGDIFLSDPQ